MGFRPTHGLTFYCGPGPTLVNLTGPDLTVKVVCGAAGVGKCNVDVFFHSAATDLTGPVRVLGCTAEGCEAKEISTKKTVDEKGNRVNGVESQTIVCEKATCGCSSTECGETLRSVLKQVTGPFALACSHSESTRDFSCTVNEAHLPIQIDLTCGAGTCRDSLPPDLVANTKKSFAISTSTIVAIVVSLATGACLVIACAQAENNEKKCCLYFGKCKNNKRNRGNRWLLIG